MKTTPGFSLFLCVLAACADRSAPPPFTTLDSAGVSIAVNNAPEWPAGTYAMGAEPLLDVGGDPAGPPIELERIARVILMHDGLAVADEGAGRILRLAADGGLLWSAGRPGDGPGEFRLIAGMGSTPADSIWVFDFGNRRFTLFSPDGEVAHTVAVSAAVSAPRVAGRLADGSFVIQEMWGSGLTTRQSSAGLTRDPAALVRLAEGDESIDTIGIFPGREFMIIVENGRGVMNTPLFSRNTAAVASGSTIAVGDQAAFDIRILDGAGTVLRRVRRTDIDLSIDPALFERATAALLEPMPESERPAARQWLEDMPAPPSRPAFDRLLFGPGGELWVSEHAPPPLEALDWHIFGIDGRWLGSLRVPERFQLESIGEDRVAGVWRDELDVEHVRVYPLTRPAA